LQIQGKSGRYIMNLSQVDRLGTSGPQGVTRTKFPGFSFCFPDPQLGAGQANNLQHQQIQTHKSPLAKGGNPSQTCRRDCNPSHHHKGQVGCLDCYSPQAVLGHTETPARVVSEKTVGAGNFTWCQWRPRGLEKLGNPTFGCWQQD
jgi:hypothetical protein